MKRQAQREESSITKAQRVHVTYIRLDGVDDAATLDHFRAELVDELARDFQRVALQQSIDIFVSEQFHNAHTVNGTQQTNKTYRGNEVIDDHHASSFLDCVVVDLHAASVEARRVVHADRVAGQPARAAHGHERDLERECERRTEDESARLAANHVRDALVRVPELERVDRELERLRVQQQRRDVAEVESRTREVGKHADLAAQVARDLLLIREVHDLFDGEGGVFRLLLVHEDCAAWLLLWTVVVVCGTSRDGE